MRKGKRCERDQQKLNEMMEKAIGGDKDVFLDKTDYDALLKEPICKTCGDSKIKLIKHIEDDGESHTTWEACPDCQDKQPSDAFDVIDQVIDARSDGYETASWMKVKSAYSHQQLRIDELEKKLESMKRCGNCKHNVPTGCKKDPELCTGKYYLWGQA